MPVSSLLNTVWHVRVDAQKKIDGESERKEPWLKNHHAAQGKQCTESAKTVIPDLEETSGNPKTAD